MRRGSEDVFHGEKRGRGRRGGRRKRGSKGVDRVKGSRKRMMRKTEKRRKREE